MRGREIRKSVGGFYKEIWVSKRRVRKFWYSGGVKVFDVEWGEIKVLRCLWEYSLEYRFFRYWIV